MAQKQSPALVVVALLLFAAATPLAHGQALLNSVTVEGELCCTPTGSCTGGAAPLSGVSVGLSCAISALGAGSGAITVGKGITGLNGGFSITLNNVTNVIGDVTTILGGKLPCNATVTLPLSQAVCPILNGVTGTLTNVPTLVSILLSPVFGLLGVFKVLFSVAVTV